ncbi:MAG: restriction endonuclease subunit S [Clostridiales bacterium]|nr:restriction endonuclease subunit S [Clostridiales bacterium]
MKYLEKLLGDTSVEYDSIGNLISRIREKGKHEKNIKTVYSVSKIQGIVKAEDFRDRVIYSSDTSNYTIIRKGMFAYTPARLNIGSIGYLKSDIAGLVSPICVVFKINENRIIKEYLFFFIKSRYCINKINSLTEIGARFRFDFKRWKLIDIPLPPLKVQQEIVRILDKFDTLTTSIIEGLPREIKLRKKQYEYYREKLFTFKEGKVEWKRLGEVCNIFVGGEPPINCIKNSIPDDVNKYPIYGNGIEVYGFTDSYRIDKDAVTISSIGSNTGNIYFRKAYFTPIIRLKVVIPKFKNLLPKYLFHYLTSIKISSKKSCVPNMSAADVKSIKIPIPPLKVQQKIVHILDKFDILTTSISEGLPREIELRKKQYEYYREKLFTFPGGTNK